MIIPENNFLCVEKGGVILGGKYPEYGAAKLISSFIRWTTWWRRMLVTEVRNTEREPSLGKMTILLDILSFEVS